MNAHVLMTGARKMAINVTEEHPCNCPRLWLKYLTRFLTRNTRWLKIKTKDPVIRFLIQHFSLPAQGCPWRVPGHTQPHGAQPYVLGLSLQCPDRPVWWGETGQLVEQVNIRTRDNSSRKWGEVFDPPATLQGLSQLHQSLSLLLLRCPQPQHTCLVVGGFNVRLPHFQRLSQGEKKKQVSKCLPSRYIQLQLR